MEEFNWYARQIKERQEFIKELQKQAVQSADISDYWKCIRLVEKKRQEIWTLEQMAKEREMYVIAED